MNILPLIAEAVSTEGGSNLIGLLTSLGTTSGVGYLIVREMFADKRRRANAVANRENAEVEWLRKEMVADRAQNSIDRAAFSEKIGRLEGKIEQLEEVNREKDKIIASKDAEILRASAAATKNYKAWAFQKKRADGLAVELQNAVRAATSAAPANR